MGLFDEIVAKIGDLDERTMAEIRVHQNNLTKPPGSLGILEEIAVQLAGITGQKFPVITNKVVVVMAGVRQAIRSQGRTFWHGEEHD